MPAYQAMSRRGALSLLGGAAVLPVAGCVQPTEELSRAAPAFNYAEIYGPAADGPHTLRPISYTEINPAFLRQVVPNTRGQIPGTIIVSTAARQLHFGLDAERVLQFGVAVGRDGFLWKGSAVVGRKAAWPTWTPPPEMIERQPELAKHKDGMKGGPRNPLGARSIYLYQGGRDTLYRIHGSPEWRSIGRNASSGCIRMLNQDVVFLYNQVQMGAPVLVE